MPEPQTTVRAALKEAVGQLQAAGCETPRLDAEVLLAHVLGADRAALHRDPDAALPAAAADDYAALITRRRAREPVAHLIGRKGFRFLELDVDARVLTPRPETEILVHEALKLPPGTRILDVGTGSGNIALALAAERPDFEVSAVDVSADAVAVARANAERLGLDVPIWQSDLLADAPGPWDAIVANLPYVRSGELVDVMPEVRDHEPYVALDGGPDGLDVIRRFAREAAGTPWLGLEVGEGMTDDVGDLLRAAGWSRIRVEPDLAGLGRVVIGET